jgi:hypothetical protein
MFESLTIFSSDQLDPLRLAFGGSSGMTAVRRMLLDAETARARILSAIGAPQLSKETDI